jgi:hypothetical protein
VERLIRPRRRGRHRTRLEHADIDGLRANRASGDALHDNMTVDLTGLDAVTGLVQDGTVRAVVERVPWLNGGVVTGLEPVSDEQLTVEGNTATVTIPWTDYHDAYTVTLLPQEAP